MNETEARRNIAAADAALKAAIREGGPTMQLGELVSGMIAIIVTATQGAPIESRAMANDMTARRIAIDLVRMVGARRVHEIVDEAAGAGAGASFQ